VLRKTHLVSLLLLLGNLGFGQSTTNPFELRPRLPEPTEVAPVMAADEPRLVNPFELRPRLESRIPDSAPPAIQVALRPDKSTAATVDRLPTGNEAIGGPLFLVNALILLLTTLLLIVSKRYVGRITRGLWNEEIMRGLYRDRTAGYFGQFLAGYSLYLMSASLFVYLLGRYGGLIEGDLFWQPLAQIGAAVTGLIVLRHLVLSIMGHIFPLQAETSQYSFCIMIFGIAAGLLLIPANLLIAYAPAELTSTAVYGTLGVLGTGYLLRALWGLRIAGPYLFNRFFHFLLYLCAVEIAPVLVLYKLFTTSL
jgi:hypothetical protein